MRNHGAKDALIAKRRRKRLDAIHRKLRQGVAEALKEKDQ
jgi:hypothetical protein